MKKLNIFNKITEVISLNEKKSRIALVIVITLLMQIFMPIFTGTSLAKSLKEVLADLKNTTTVIKFDDKDWYLIDYDDDTVTLFSKECIGADAYNTSHLFVEYNNSTIKGVIDTWYGTNISSEAKTAVDGGEMFLLTVKQAQKIRNENVDVLKCLQPSEAVVNVWWVCTCGDYDYKALGVWGSDGYIAKKGWSVDITSLGVRPALKLDLSKVEFDDKTHTFALPTVVVTSNVTLNTNGGIINSGDITTYDEGTGAILPTDVTKEGYTFSGWYDNAELTGEAVTSIETDVTGDKEYWAKWTPATYTITLNTNKGTIKSGNVTNYTYENETILPTDVIREGYTFSGWYDNAELTGEAVTFIGTDATGDKEYWAKWSEIAQTSEVYKILEGTDQTHEVENGKDLIIRANGDISKFIGLKVDDVTLSTDNYDVQLESTTITTSLKSAYLDTLSEGTHKLTFVYNDGEVSTNFKIAKVNTAVEETTSSNPKTGDTGIAVWVFLIVVSMLGIACTVKFSKESK